MISHIHLPVLQFPRAHEYWSQILPALGWKLRFCDQTTPWAGWQPAHLDGPEGRPLLIYGKPFAGEPVPGNGNMVALLAPSRAAVDLAHAQALAHGGTCEGPPGLRAHYHPHYYGAYFRDSEGNKVCVCRHDAQD